MELPLLLGHYGLIPGLKTLFFKEGNSSIQDCFNSASVCPLLMYIMPLISFKFIRMSIEIWVIVSWISQDLTLLSSGIFCIGKIRGLASVAFPWAWFDQFVGFLIYLSSDFFQCLFMPIFLGHEIFRQWDLSIFMEYSLFLLSAQIRRCESLWCQGTASKNGTSLAGPLLPIACGHGCCWGECQGQACAPQLEQRYPFLCFLSVYRSQMNFIVLCCDCIVLWCYCIGVCLILHPWKNKVQSANLKWERFCKLY